MRSTIQDQRVMRGTFITLAALIAVLAVISEPGNGAGHPFTEYATVVSWWTCCVGLFAPWSRLWQAVLWSLPPVAYGFMMPWLQGWNV